MTTPFAIPEKAAEERMPGVSSLDETAETIRDDALALVKQRLHIIQRDANLESLFRHPDFFDRFKDGLAAGVAKALAANDQRVLVIYTYDPLANPDKESGEEMPLDATVHLLVLVATPSAALSAFVASLDRALTASLKSLPSPLFVQRESVLDVNLITEKDVRLGLGYAALLSSLFVPPIKVWAREA